MFNNIDNNKLLYPEEYSFVDYSSSQPNWQGRFVSTDETYDYDFQNYFPNKRMRRELSPGEQLAKIFEEEISNSRGMVGERIKQAFIKANTYIWENNPSIMLMTFLDEYSALETKVLKTFGSKNLSIINQIKNQFKSELLILSSNVLKKINFLETCTFFEDISYCEYDELTQEILTTLKSEFITKHIFVLCNQAKIPFSANELMKISKFYKNHPKENLLKLIISKAKLQEFNRAIQRGNFDLVYFKNFLFEFGNLLKKCNIDVSKTMEATTEGVEYYNSLYGESDPLAIPEDAYSNDSESEDECLLSDNQKEELALFWSLREAFNEIATLDYQKICNISDLTSIKKEYDYLADLLDLPPMQIEIVNENGDLFNALFQLLQLAKNNQKGQFTTLLKKILSFDLAPQVRNQLLTLSILAEEISFDEFYQLAVTTNDLIQSIFE